MLQDDLYFYEIHNIDYSKELSADPNLSIRFKALHEQLIETISECVMPIPSGVSNIVAASNPPPPPLRARAFAAYRRSALPPQPVALPSMSPSSYVSLSAESPPQPLEPPNLLEYFKTNPVGPPLVKGAGHSTRRRRRRTRRRVVARRYSIKRTNNTNKRQNKRKYKNKK